MRKMVILFAVVMTGILTQISRMRALLLRFFWIEFFQAHLLGNIRELLGTDSFQLFTARLDLFVQFDDAFRHLFVRFLRTADQLEIITGRDALMSVRIQAKA